MKKNSSQRLTDHGPLQLSRGKKQDPRCKIREMQKRQETRADKQDPRSKKQEPRSKKQRSEKQKKQEAKK